MPTQSDSEDEEDNSDEDEEDDDLNENNTLPLEWDDSASVHTGSEGISANGSILSGHHGMSQADSPVMDAADVAKLDIDDVELATEHGVLTSSSPPPPTTSAMNNHMNGPNGSVRHETIALVDPCDIPRPSSPRIGLNPHPSAFTMETIHGDGNSHTDISLDSPEHTHNSNKKPLLKDKLHLDLTSNGKGSKGKESPTLHSPSYVMSPIRSFKEVPIMKNSYMSPMIADDELLKGLPPVHVIVSIHL